MTNWMDEKGATPSGTTRVETTQAIPASVTASQSPQDDAQPPSDGTGASWLNRVYTIKPKPEMFWSIALGILVVVLLRIMQMDDEEIRTIFGSAAVFIIPFYRQIGAVILNVLAAYRVPKGQDDGDAG